MHQMLKRRFSVDEVGYSTHGIYRYPGKFIPQIPNFYIKSYSMEDDVVLDPFCGSGTTLVEAMLLGRNSYGVDVHPLARLVSKVKTTKIDLNFNDVKNFFSGLSHDYSPVDEIVLNFRFKNFFNIEVLRKIFILRERIFEVEDENVRNLFLVSLLSIIKSSANIDERRIHIVRKKKPEIDVYELFMEKLKQNIFVVRKLRGDVFCEVIGKDAKKIPLEDKSVDLIVTSPPYINALNYRDVHKIETSIAKLKEDFSGYIGVDAEVENSFVDSGVDSGSASSEASGSNSCSNSCGGSKKLLAVEKYFKDMEEVFYELGRVLKPGKYLCLIIEKNSVIREIKFNTADMLKTSAENFDLEEKTYRYASKEYRGRGDKILIFKRK